MDIRELNKASTLQALTGQESGIVIYHNNNGCCDSVLAVNWSCMNDYELPVSFEPFPRPLGWSYGKWTVDAIRNVDDIRNELPGTIDITKNDDGTLSAECPMDIVLDCNGAIPALYGIDVESGTYSQPEPTSGRCYSLSIPEKGMEVKVIAPEGWA